MRQALLASCILALLLSACDKGPDVPPPTFTQTTETAFERYLSRRSGDPVAFIVSEDGEYSYSLICPIWADRCVEVSQAGGTAVKGLKDCEQRAKTPCHVYARGIRVVWN